MESSSSDKHTTLYSMVVGLAGGTGNRQQYLDRFVELYGDPLKSYLVSSMRLDEDLTHDIIQDFLVQKLLDPKNQFAANYLERRATDKNLSFRWYLLRSLRNFAIDKLRLRSREKEAAQKLPAYDPRDHTTQVFETEWAGNLLAGALRDMKEQCIQEDSLDLWAIFEARIVTPSIQGKKPSLGELADSAGISVRAVQRRLTSSKQKFRAILRRTVADYLPLVGKHGEGLLESELMDLIQTAASLKLLTVSLDDSGALSLFEFADKAYVEEYSPRDCAELWNSIASERLESFAFELGDHSLDFATLEKSGLATVRQLWSFPSPPISLLQLIKEFAKKTGKQSMRDVESVYPLPICIALYQLAIATAWQRYEQTRLSRMEPNALLERLPTVLAYDWLDDDARRLLESWRDDLKTA